ncbi:hypothetical protein HELRODRAFT_63024 [Helobdella robusta]|uniref:Peptidase S54 rhomboid domain-containing protein n=1 Tax=Helobdella robusta TaxID=6412 RepID=T1FX99_HELRO|nr:hypothetical protein HELRODRAFT_63024 [Helobdella robusta]ESO12763.1 hypothetical protein HELRODRAFT_63024 [Helobdella robusta]
MGRPCCIGVLGVCIITTREYCNFKRGAFYQEAYQCSQANCFVETCGLQPFLNPKVPDQLFVMVVTLFFQMIIMYDLERLTGTFEMTIVYVLCGCCGNLFSGIFMPYYIELGPSGSQFGVLSILFVEIIRWNIQEQPRTSFCIAIFVLLVLFMVGLIVPQVDNWAHSCGLIYGSFISIAFRPVRRIVNRPISRFMITFQRLIGVVFTVFIPAVLLFFFYYVNMEFECTACVHFNCVSFTRDYCEGTSITLEYNNMMLTYEL